MRQPSSQLPARPRRQVFPVLSSVLSGIVLAGFALGLIIFLNTPGTWSQHAYLKDADDEPDERDEFFGWSVAASGNTVVVSALAEQRAVPHANDSDPNRQVWEVGAVYVFVRSGTTWTYQASLSIPDARMGDGFGHRVAISGDTIVIGVPGEHSGATIINDDPRFNATDQAGAAYVFVRSGTTWTQQAVLTASPAKPQTFFGASVAIADDTIVVGALGEGVNASQEEHKEDDAPRPDTGAVSVFRRTGTTWSEEATLHATPPQPGTLFGSSIAVAGTTIVVGNIQQPGVEGSMELSLSTGAAYVFARVDERWEQQAMLTASNGEAEDAFGVSVATSGDTIIVGAIGEDSGARGVNGDQADNTATNAGAAYVFRRTGATWSQHAYLKASNTEAGDSFGFSVAMWGDMVVVSAEAEDSAASGVNGDQASNGASHAGAVYVFGRDGTTWSQTAYLKASNTDDGDGFGNSIALSGSTIIVGAWGERSLASGVNGDQTGNQGRSIGAAYVFER